MAVLDKLIGLIAPPSCMVCGQEGSALCSGCAKTQIVPYGERCFACGAVSGSARTCERCRPGAPRYVWVSTNYEAAARELVKIYKFGHQRAAAESLASLMVGTFYYFNPAVHSMTRSWNYLIVPVPTATSRIRQRSFDHSAHLACQVARKLKAKHLNALARIGQSRQVGAERSVRLDQPAGNYLVRYPYLIKGQNILLIDDVVTTGATLRATTKILRAAGAARVDALVFAKRL